MKMKELSQEEKIELVKKAVKEEHTEPFFGIIQLEKTLEHISKDYKNLP